MAHPCLPFSFSSPSSPSLTPRCCHRAGGVAELESKARNRGMRVTYLAPPANNPDPDSLLIALTMQ